MKELNIPAYEVIEDREILDLHSRGLMLRHKKSGARIAILSNDDENKVFSIGFRTPPEDSTGLPHILEHSVLCGSKNFPAKDPFVELVKGSMNTFLNAMTYPDKTVYPVASTNDQDFQNLMHVYMDAVFFTNIYEEEKIFRQEGWHYDLESADAPLKINGVVYNEMKGAFSSPEGVLDRVILNSLFPDTCYRHESGGDPDVIPELTYLQFLDFHSKYYHPSNSYLYLYGDMDVEEKLAWLDKEYLGKYQAFPVHSEIGFQKPFLKPVEMRKKYSISSSESEEDNTYLSYNMVIDTSLNKELYLAFQIIAYALFSAPGAPVQQALLDAKIGKDVMSNFDNGIYQPIFTIAVKNANISDKEHFLDVVRSTLTELVKNGIDEKALLAGINYNEFRFREADFGSYPKGLMYGLQMYDSWLYDENKPFVHLEVLDTFKFMKEKVGTGYFEELVQKYMLDNPHSSVVIIEPEKELTAKVENELAEKLAAYKASLSPEQIDELVRKTKELEEYQEEPSSKEALEKIPVLKLSDIKKEAAPIELTEKKCGKYTVLHHELQTNGIGYLNLIFDVKNVPEELVPYMGILRTVLGNIDTENYGYGDLFNEINVQTGGVMTTVETYSDLSKPGEFKVCYQVRAKALYEKLPFAFRMIEEILFHSKLSDEKRLSEIVAQLKSRLQMNINSSGNAVAVNRAISYYSKLAYYKELIGGVSFYQTVDRIERNFEEEKESLIEGLKALMLHIFRPENMMVSYTAEKEGYQVLEKELLDFEKLLHTETVEKKDYTLCPVKLNEAFPTGSKVQYVAKTGNYLSEGYEYTGALKVLRVILSYDYLWNNLRVQGGAYGCSGGFNRSGDVYFASYRDPHLERTIRIYDQVVDYIRNFTVDERDMKKYIIGTVSDLDTPLPPSSRGDRALSAWMMNLSYERLQRERDEVLNCNVDKLRELAPLVETALKKDNLCVIGSETKIEEEKELFQNIVHLF